MALNTPINLNMFVLHVENSHGTPPPLKAIIRQALFNINTRYENTTHTLRLIAIASQAPNSATYVISRVGEEWIVDEDERHLVSYLTCLRAGQLSI